MNKYRFLALLLFLHLGDMALAQPGCTDPMATNYDPTAVVNDGSCVYPATTLPLTVLTELATPLLDENSGIQVIDGELWTHVDDRDSNLYRIDSMTAAVLDTIPVRNAWNSDWEDLGYDSNYVYLGDVGNNVGSRTNLAFFRFDRSQLSSGSAFITVDTIRFSYPDQTDFTPVFDSTRYDCEAFVILQDTIHLFTKDWLTKRTRRYLVPAVPGTHPALLVDSLEADGLITSAAVSRSGVVALLGYDNVVPAPCFLWLLYDYPGTAFFSGNKRRLSLGSAITAGQVEGICFREGLLGYISSERFQQLVFNVPPRLYRFDLSPYVSSTITSIDESAPTNIRLIREENGYLLLHPGLREGRYQLFSLSGQLAAEAELGAGYTSVSDDSRAPGTYLLILTQEGRQAGAFKVRF